MSFRPTVTGGRLPRHPQEVFTEILSGPEKPELTARHFGFVGCVFIGVSFIADCVPEFVQGVKVTSS